MSEPYNLRRNPKKTEKGKQTQRTDDNTTRPTYQEGGMSTELENNPRPSDEDNTPESTASADHTFIDMETINPSMDQPIDDTPGEELPAEISTNQQRSRPTQSPDDPGTRMDQMMQILLNLQIQAEQLQQNTKQNKLDLHEQLQQNKLDLQEQLQQNSKQNKLDLHEQLQQTRIDLSEQINDIKIQGQQTNNKVDCLRIDLSTEMKQNNDNLNKRMDDLQTSLSASIQQTDIKLTEVTQRIGIMEVRITNLEEIIKEKVDGATANIHNTIVPSIQKYPIHTSSPLNKKQLEADQLNNQCHNETPMMEDQHIAMEQEHFEQPRETIQSITLHQNSICTNITKTPHVKHYTKASLWISKQYIIQKYGRLPYHKFHKGYSKQEMLTKKYTNTEHYQIGSSEINLTFLTSKDNPKSICFKQPNLSVFKLSNHSIANYQVNNNKWDHLKPKSSRTKPTIEDAEMKLLNQNSTNMYILSALYYKKGNHRKKNDM